MKNIQITAEEVQNIVQENLPKIITDAFDGYNSPIKKAVEEAISDHEGQIKKMVNGVLKDILTDADFRAALGDKVLEQVLTKGLKG